ncbi:hypothetical protein RB195_014757 [Necator americanus]|uniref:Uncharacterized protein n=1 Tax=Necator americanus TaxID=51031 RepID=A0ABR1E1Z8_NECAM
MQLRTNYACVQFFSFTLVVENSYTSSSIHPKLICSIPLSNLIQDENWFHLQCGCGTASYGYQQSSNPAYPSPYSSLSPYPPGPISGYILRPVDPVRNSGYAVAGGAGEGGIPVVHNQYGQIGYVQSPYGTLPNGPFYWQPSAGSPYERVLVGGLRF